MLKTSKKKVTSKAPSKPQINTNKKQQHRRVTKTTKRRVASKSSPQLALTPPKQQSPSPFTSQRANVATVSRIKDFQSEFPTRAVGTGLDYQLFFFAPESSTDDLTKAISPWHDIPLVNSRPADGKGDIIFNFICEIPKGTVAKYEINTKSASNPIKQDVKNGQLRNFKYGNIPFNYGALPQTWEDPKHIDSMMKLGGDNDPLDIVEMSPGPLQHGVVYPVKIVGALALIDEGEVDWKLLAIEANHPVATKLQDAHSLDSFLPSFEGKLKDWFQNYKTAEGKGQNQFGYNDKLLPKAKAIEIVQQCHDAWAQLCAPNAATHGLAVQPLPEGFHPQSLNH